jgi:threonylcarbamoyladenosine tRNA methylthiotransferase MtaB
VTGQIFTLPILAQSPTAPTASHATGVDNKEKEHLLALSQTLSLEGRGLGEGETKQSQVLAATTRTRSLIKIQDGCHSSCTYCIVPKVRPHEYSLPVSQIIDEVRQKVALGYKEVVLTGTKVGSYKDDDTGLRDLIQRILTSTGIERLRLSSLQSSEISSELLALWQDEKLCRHFHLALQSGSETVLQRMRRSYSLNRYQRTVNLIKNKIPNVAITTDIMVGFPGESDEEFEQSYSFCQQAGFANIHVFPFSPRPETAAARIPEQIKDKVKQERNQRMLELSRSSRCRFCEQFLGQTMPVLWEKETSPGSGIYSGLTGNYIRVFAHSKKPLSNEITPVKLVEFYNQGIWGEMVDENPG